MKILCLLLCLLAATILHAQEQPGVNCHPIQGQGWSGCAPIYPSQPQSQQPQNVPLPPDFWINHYGAIVSDDALTKLGVSTNRLSEAEAWHVAEEDCHAKGGVNCVRLISYRNQCVAMVAGGGDV